MGQEIRVINYIINAYVRVNLVIRIIAFPTQVRRGKLGLKCSTTRFQNDDFTR